MKKRFTKVRLGEGLEEGRTDWKRVQTLSDDDIARAVDEDPDTFELNSDWLDTAVIVRPARPKEKISARFDKDVLDWFKSQGEGYQSRMNAVLRAYYEAQTRRNPSAR